MALSKPQLEIVYRENEFSLYNFALRWVFDSALAEEVVHDAFVRVWNKRDTVDPETVKSLLYKTVQNLALNEIRRRKLKESFSFFNWFSDESEDLEQGLIQEQDLRSMRQALEGLDQELREVLLLAEFSDLSYAQIAQALEIPEGTVASRKSRALQWLRENMEVKNG